MELKYAKQLYDNEIIIQGDCNIHEQEPELLSIYSDGDGITVQSETNVYTSKVLAKEQAIGMFQEIIDWLKEIDNEQC